MSKKKATMTLKDFHGGSIPSDHPLPSAPGVIVKPSDRPSFDRQTAWGVPTGRSEQRLRPGSAGSMRNFDDRAPFLTNSAHIGRNFDEDERKPLEGIPTLHKTMRDETVRTQPIQMETKVEPTRPHTTPASQLSSYAARFTESTPRMGPNSQNVGANAVGEPCRNAWGLRKEVADSGPATWSAPEAEKKLAHASALEKVTSGRWHSKQLIQSTDVEVVKHPETDSDSSYNKGVEYYDATVSDSVSMYKVTQAPVHVNSLERPSLKLLPRSKPSVETFVVYDQHQNFTGIKENDIETREKAKPMKHGLAASDGGNYAVVERPKLNLKPRSQPPEQFEGITEIERNVLFGGARPREFVLKERGIDDVADKIQNQGQPPNRTETLLDPAPKAYTAKAGNTPLDHRISKNIVKSNQRTNIEKRDVHKNWRSENRSRTSRQVDKLQQQPQERPPSPDTWRKPVVQPASHDPSNPRYGKAASAVDLALAFSKPVSVPKTGDRFSVQGSIPFSRLAGSNPRPRINGY